jgi:thioester reductase-like protein
MNVLLTGGFGFLGQSILYFLLHHKEVREIYLPVRRKHGASVQARLLDVLRGLGLPPDDRIKTFESSLDSPQFGLDDVEYSQLSTNTHVVIHCAGNVKFNVGYSESYRDNVATTLEVLRFGRKKRMVYISTAYVARPGAGGGGGGGHVPMHDDHFNNYTRTKLMGEHVFEQAVDFTIVRPSIISSAWSHPQMYSGSNGLGGMLELFHAFLLNCVNPSLSINSVPVDYVGESVVKISLAHAPRYVVLAAEQNITDFPHVHETRRVLVTKNENTWMAVQSFLFLRYFKLGRLTMNVHKYVLSTYPLRTYSFVPDVRVVDLYPDFDQERWVRSISERSRENVVKKIDLGFLAKPLLFSLFLLLIAYY